MGTLTKAEISSVDSGCQEITERITDTENVAGGEGMDGSMQKKKMEADNLLCNGQLDWIIFGPTEEVKIFTGSKLSLSCVLIFAKSHPHFCD